MNIRKPAIFTSVLLLSILILTRITAAGIEYAKVRTGAERVEEYLPLLKNKKVAIVANQTSLICNTHLVDSLLALGVNVIRLFSPEHGFRGDADAGEHVGNYTDKKTGLDVISLHGDSKKPKVNDLDETDIVLFDLQDVGVRFYTYISTMHYVMEACLENDIELIVLDRPNPNGFYIDGPVLDLKYKSFLGMHPVPVVHGMTIGEYALMINGEGWLGEGKTCRLKVISCEGYTHSSYYRLPVKPSPNLPNMESVYLYPSLGLFEGTAMSVGRGTDFPFQVVGHPEIEDTSFSFIPRSIEGADKNPKYKGITCNGVDLRSLGIHLVLTEKRLHLEWIMDAYKAFPQKDKFFTSGFTRHTGNAEFKQQIIDGTDAATIRSGWQKNIEKFKVVRRKYLLYPDFE
ncbi:MAG: DUF1343 domain-containing protein [Bacteroidetes bacterium]|nr:DUF1343 domain-containing protein [Bacteroidota bacterium]